ncbi:MAG: tryptophan-rich sensory protein [Flavobacteriaceae bacterium]|nr:tryptophan-rich sensory protein [Flavobacteriaceae bacterium]
MKKTLQVLNGIAFVSMIFINYLSNTGLINGNTNASVSREVENLFTPAGYAFSIWGIIYLFLFGFVIYQGLGLFSKSKDNDFADQVGWWFVISCLANSLWLFAWLHESLGLALVIMLVLLFSLIKIVRRTNMALWGAPLKTNLFLWWPFCLYIGWISVALIANVAAYLTKINWDGFGLNEVFWTISMIIVAGLLNLFVTWKRNMREFAYVGAWALIAIAVANLEREQTISVTATVVAIVLILSSVFHTIKKWKVLSSLQKK